jgi:hypothetical protein
MQIIKTGDEQFRMTISPAETHIFINCMNETVRRIPSREYQTRMGAKVDEIKAVVASLEGALK